MLDALRFVQGSLAKKDFVGALTHFRIQDGHILGHNGNLTLSSPIALNLECKPKGTPFLKAIQACATTVTMHLTATGRLSIKSGKFKALVDCTEEDFPPVEPTGEVIKLQGGLVKALKALEPFIAEDASRPWARGILFRGHSAYATNNVILAEHWLGEASVPVVINVPRSAVMELIRIGEEPHEMQVTESSVTFHYSNHRWLRSNLYSTEWPDLGKLFDSISWGSIPKAPEGLAEALETLNPFKDKLEHAYFEPGRISTDSSHEVSGATVELEGITTSAIFNLVQLQKVLKLVTSLDISSYPKPCPFVGEGFRGVMVGMRS
jgi:hypothetical protein